MKVVLIKNVPNLGKIGEIKNVSEGYARNFLLTRGLVKIASDSNIKEMAILQQSKANAHLKKAKKYKELAKKLNNLKLTLKMKASAFANASADKDDKKTLFGSVTAQSLANELVSRGYNVEPKFVKLDQHIKALGYYDVLLDFGAGITSKIGLTIIRED